MIQPILNGGGKKNVTQNKYGEQTHVTFKLKEVYQYNKENMNSRGKDEHKHTYKLYRIAFNSQYTTGRSQSYTVLMAVR